MNEYLVLSRTNGTTRTGSPYALLKVANTDETLNLAVWDLAPTAQPEVGQLVTIYMITEKGGKKSCGAQDLAAGGFPDAGHPLYHLLPRPVAREEWDKTIAQLLSYCTDDTLADIIRQFADKLYAPTAASRRLQACITLFPAGCSTTPIRCCTCSRASIPACLTR